MCFTFRAYVIFGGFLLHIQDITAATITGGRVELFQNFESDILTGDRCNNIVNCSENRNDNFERSGDVRCGENLFRCGDGSCVDYQVKCDGVPDCADGSDESENICINLPTLRNTTADEPLALRHKRSSLCTLPPQPEHGTYTQVPYPDTFPPGLDILILEYECFPPYKLVGQSRFICNRGLSHEYPTCQLVCKLSRYEDMHFRCLASNDPADGYTKCNYVLPLGAKVQPFCKVHYFSRVPLNLMTCVNGTWDYMPDTCKPECGTIIPKGTPLMSGGGPAKYGELPWHVGIYYKKKKKLYEQICGGTIIGRKVVLSAAHCFWKLGSMQPPCRYAVQAGKLSRAWQDEDDGEVQQRGVIDVRIPPHYRGIQTNFQDDLAIVILGKSFFFKMLVQPVCLDFGPEMDSRHLKPGNMGKVAGWGYTSEDGEPSPFLKVADLPSVGIQQCLNDTSFGFRVYITVDKICAGYTNGTATVCKGDSGGGLSFPEPVNGATKYYLRGIVSTAPADGLTCNTLTLTTFTHVASHHNFIKSHFENSDRLGFQFLYTKLIGFYNDSSVCND